MNKKRAAIMGDQELVAALDEADKEWEELRAAVDDEGMAGSPGEWLWERMSELETELKRRGIKRPDSL